MFLSFWFVLDCFVLPKTIYLLRDADVFMTGLFASVESSFTDISFSWKAPSQIPIFSLRIFYIVKCYSVGRYLPDCRSQFHIVSLPLPRFKYIHKYLNIFTYVYLRPCSNLCEGGSFLCIESCRWSTDDAADAFNFSIRHRFRLSWQLVEKFGFG